MPSVRVDLASRSYDVIIEDQLLIRSGAAVAAAGLRDGAAVISDSNVAPLHARTLLDSLAAAGIRATLHTTPAGESAKCFDRIAALCSELAAAGHDRSSFIIALGGGVVGDLAGFAAAIFYRGIPFVQIPTTIVAQVDSSVGGKTGINLPEGKNLIGSFHQPRLVLVDPETLHTLPPREFHEGFAEVIKHAAIRDAPMLGELATLDPGSTAVSADLIARNIAIKARIVEQDEHETTGVRALLNFGHTIGHGIEAAVPYGELLHGEAISLGLRAAVDLSCKHAGLSGTDAGSILRLLHHFRLPVVLPDHLDTERILDKLSRDKKFAAGTIRFVLIRKPGDAYLSDRITLEDLRLAIEGLREEV